MGLGLTSTRLVRGANERIRTEIPFNSYMTISITMHTSTSRARRGRKWRRTIHRKDGDRAIDLHEAMQESIEAGSARIAPTNFVDILHFFSPPPYRRSSLVCQSYNYFTHQSAVPASSPAETSAK